MTGLALVLGLHGDAPHREELSEVESGLGRRGDAGTDRRWEGPLALAVLRGRTDPIEVIDDDGETLVALVGWAVWDDGRPAELPAVAAAWRSSGAAALEALAGEHLVVTWDRRTSRLEVLRDALGVESLHLARSSRRLVVASDAAGVVAHRGIGRDVDRVGVAEHLVLGHVPEPTRTVLAGVERLAAGSTLTADAAGRHSVRRWWVPGTDVDLRGRGDAEIDALVGPLLDAAVDDRLRGRSPAAVHLSGGLDSSTVAGVAAATGHRPQLVSLRFPGRPHDEGVHQRAVVEATGLGWLTEPGTPVGGFEALVEEARRTWLPAPAANGRMWRGMEDRLAELGVGPVLSGHGGDELFGRTGGDVLSLGLHGPHRSWALRRPPRSWVPLVRPAVQALAPRWVRRALRRPDLPGYLRPDLPGRDELLERYLDALVPRGVDVARELRRRGVLGAAKQHELEVAARAAARVGITPRYPLLDRRLVEVGLRLGEEQRIGPTGARGLHRRLAAGRVPPSVLARTDKANFAEVTASGADAVLAGWVPSAELGEWVSAEGCVALVDRYRAGRHETNPIGRREVWWLAAVDALLSAIH